MYGGLIQTHGRNCPLILLLSLVNHNRLGALAMLAKGNDGDLFSQGSMPVGANWSGGLLYWWAKTSRAGRHFLSRPTDGPDRPSLR